MIVTSMIWIRKQTNWKTVITLPSLQDWKVEPVTANIKVQARKTKVVHLLDLRLLRLKKQYQYQDSILNPSKINKMQLKNILKTTALWTARIKAKMTTVLFECYKKVKWWPRILEAKSLINLKHQQKVSTKVMTNLTFQQTIGLSNIDKVFLCTTMA